MPRTGVQPRSVWADQFRTPTEDELVGGVSADLRAGVECLRGRLMGIDGTTVSIEWVGIPWRWSLVLRARGMERVLGYVIPCPDRPIFVMPLTSRDLAVIVVKRTPKYICDGILRARYRDSFQHPEPLEPGKIYRFEIDLWATSNVFKAGHSIRLEISSSNFPRFDRNPNTGSALGEDTALRPASQMVLHNSRYPSCVTLPVIPS